MIHHQTHRTQHHILISFHFFFSNLAILYARLLNLGNYFWYQICPQHTSHLILCKLKNILILRFFKTQYTYFLGCPFHSTWYSLVFTFLPRCLTTLSLLFCIRDTTYSDLALFMGPGFSIIIISLKLKLKKV